MLSLSAGMGQGKGRRKCRNRHDEVFTSFNTRDGLVMPFPPSKEEGLDSTSEDGLSEALSLFFLRVQSHDGLDTPAAPPAGTGMRPKLPSSFQKRERSTSPRRLRGVNLTRSSVLNWYRRRHCRWESTLPIFSILLLACREGGCDVSWVWHYRGLDCNVPREMHVDEFVCLSCLFSLGRWGRRALLGDVSSCLLEFEVIRASMAPCS